jgi:hypothetical protein
MHDEGLDPREDPRRVDGPSAKPARVYLIPAGLILVPIIVILVFLGPKARFDSDSDSEVATPIAERIVTVSRFPPEPDETGSPWAEPARVDLDPNPDAVGLETSSPPELFVTSPTLPEDEPTDGDSHLTVLSSEAATSVFLFPVATPDRWNPGTHPAPIHQVYLRVHLELELVTGRDARLTFGGHSPRPTDVILKSDDNQVIPVLGTVEDPPNLIAPVSQAPLSITADDPTRELILAAIIPASAERLECNIGPKLSFPLEIKPDEPFVQSDSICDTWTKAEAQSWRTRYPDRLTDRIRRDDQRRLLISRVHDRPDEFEVQFPLCDVVGSAHPLISGRAEYWRFDLIHQGRSKSVPARLATNGSVLILYFGDTPHDCFVYTR